ncbi:hypothetical protein STCU_01073 [Strigomonas culicis]|uniref:Ubiquitin-like domain-containing protein n=1 Tax=Strigomonas culicis TaxID=28005 RepID=S9W8R2_9TRYP|nr:hypothetical protein STCU_01073 [Strigomonas culicis]|eukprot:EPY35601.1 hypothetical protein STCU_01073 [Strigomonas culicis]
MSHNVAGAGGPAVYDDSADSADEWAAPLAPLPPEVEEAEHAGRTSAHNQTGTMDALERELEGDRVDVVLQLPSGKAVEKQFFMGQTVEYIKVVLEKEEGLPYNATRLYLGPKMLLDPLSLCDLPFKTGEKNMVRVEVTA